jgi:amidase
MGKLRRPSRERIRELASLDHLSPSEQELADFERLIDKALGMFDVLDTLPQPKAELRYADRGSWWRPGPGEDPCNAFIVCCNLRGASDGKLKGKRVGLKDNIRLAGVPMTNGSALMSGYVPSTDAVVVERLLDAGASITGKLNMDDFGFAGTSETSAFGVIRNPVNLEHSAGGSSGGCGAAVVTGDVDIAIAVDQGGSGRIPAAWCGAVALKATHGLVPSYGITYLDHTIDFVTPITRSVSELAQVMEVIAGDDPRDAQWVRGPVRTEPYTEALGQPVRGMRVGVLAEGLTMPTLEADVKEAFESAVAVISKLGTTVEPVSFPLWTHGQAIWNGFAAHSISAMIESNQEGYGRLGLCDLGWQQAFGDARRARGDMFPPYMKMLMIMGAYLRRDLGSVYFGKATNLRYRMRREFDALFDRFDVILTPTIPMKAFRLLTSAPSIEEMGQRAAGMCQNTYPLNVTGNPGLTIPCGKGDNGLPIGLQIIARHFHDATAIRLAHAYEGARGDS